MHWDGTDKCVLATAQDNQVPFSKKASLSAKGRTQRDGMLAILLISESQMTVIVPNPSLLETSKLGKHGLKLPPTILSFHFQK